MVRVPGCVYVQSHPPPLRRFHHPHQPNNNLAKVDVSKYVYPIPITCDVSGLVFHGICQNSPLYFRTRRAGGETGDRVLRIQ